VFISYVKVIFIVGYITLRQPQNSANPYEFEKYKR